MKDEKTIQVSPLELTINIVETKIKTGGEKHGIIDKPGLCSDDRR